MRRDLTDTEFETPFRRPLEGREGRVKRPERVARLFETDPPATDLAHRNVSYSKEQKHWKKHVKNASSAAFEMSGAEAGPRTLKLLR
jgi:hypothetical protein